MATHHTLRSAALLPWAQTDPAMKAQSTLALDLSLPIGVDEVLSAPSAGPGRAARPVLVPHTQLKAKSMATPEGRAMLVHAIAHIELNAIDLALDVVWRFGGMPESFYTDWVRIAQEEAKHFGLLRQHLLDMGFDYGDFPAHNTLWDMAERTQEDLLARIGIVPRTMEARGLDASPGVKNKLGVGWSSSPQMLLTPNVYLMKFHCLTTICNVFCSQTGKLCPTTRSHPIKI